MLQQGARDALADVLRDTAGLPLLFVLGLPLTHGGKLYNCAAVCQNGRVLGVVPKTHLPNYNEFYEKRQFTPAPAENGVIDLSGAQVPFGTNLLFQCGTQPALTLAVEICEDLWAPLPPSTRHAMAGATLICNLSASDETIGKAEYRRALVTGQSARLLCGYVYADAGEGESTTDMVFAGHNMVAENGALLAETAPFCGGMALTDIDVERLAGERLKTPASPLKTAQTMKSSHSYCRKMSLRLPASSHPLLLCRRTPNSAPGAVTPSWLCRRQA